MSSGIERLSAWRALTTASMRASKKLIEPFLLAFDLYMARSAWETSTSALASSMGKIEMPTLIETSTCMSSISVIEPTALATFSEISIAAPAE